MLNRQSASGGGRNRDETRTGRNTRKRGVRKDSWRDQRPKGFKATDFTVAMLFSRHFLIALSPQKRRSNASSCAEITPSRTKRETNETNGASLERARRWGQRGNEREREGGGKERRKETVKGREEATRDRNRFAIASVYSQTPGLVYTSASLYPVSLSNYSPARH